MVSLKNKYVDMPVHLTHEEYEMLCTSAQANFRTPGDEAHYILHLYLYPKAKVVAEKVEDEENTAK